MPSFTNLEVNHVLSNMLPAFVKGKPTAQNVQDMPVLQFLDRFSKKHSAGHQELKLPVVNRGGVALTGFNSDEDTITHVNPQNTRWATYGWYDHVASIFMGRQEALLAGIEIDDTLSATRVMTGADKQILVNTITEKGEEMGYGIKKSKVDLFWGDGVAQPKALAGIRSLILDTPAVGTTGGINRATNPFWRNRAAVGANAIVANLANAADGVLTRFMDREARQLRRYANGVAPQHMVFAGSDFIEQLKNERFAKGSFSDTGFTATQDLSSGDVKFGGGLMPIYDPALDDLGFSKRCYVIDGAGIMVNEVQEVRFSEVARPADRFVFARTATWVAGLGARRLNTSGVYEIA